MSAHEGNPAPGVGGTAKDGGISTAATVSDGGPNDKNPDPSYVPKEVMDMPEGQHFTRSGQAHAGNPAPGVGGTAKDGGLSTAATVADGGPNDAKKDATYEPK